MTFCSKLLTGAFLTLASAFGWNSAQAQQDAMAKEQALLALLSHKEGASRLLSDYQGEIN